MSDERTYQEQRAHEARILNRYNLDALFREDVPMEVDNDNENEPELEEAA